MMIDLLQSGIVPTVASIAFARVAVGTFFSISGANKLFNKCRHRSLTNNLKKNHIPWLPFMQWWVPFWEFVSGALLALGILSAFNAAVLIIICIVACCAEARDKVEKYQPINFGDRIADYLYLPEVLYIIILMLFV